MRLSEPPWWYADRLGLLARALTPIGNLWGKVALRRYARGEHYRSPIPVVCIGNFTAGGTGKTPLALLVATELHRLGARPAFLSRGFGGRIAGPHWVDPESDSARDVGDEPLLLSRLAPTLICRDRAAGARAIQASEALHGAIVMDDGLQNGSLDKNLRLAVVDGSRGIGNGLVMPAGPLRAPLAFQLGLVDAIIVNSPSGAGLNTNAFPQWLRGSFTGPVITASTAPSGNTEWLHETPVLAFSGIGAPERFFALLERLGAKIQARRIFADHHAFTESESRRLLAEAERLGAALVTTEKDWIRLSSAGASGRLKAAAKVLAVEMNFADRDRLRLMGLIEALLLPGTHRRNDTRFTGG